MDLRNYILIGSLIVSFVYYVIITIYYCIKNNKIKNELKEDEYLLKWSNSKKVLLEDIIPEAIKYAEKSGVGKGTLKKLIAENKVVSDCNAENIDVDMSYISNMIEAFISFSKNVNCNQDKVRESGVSEIKDNNFTENKYQLK